MVLLLVILIGLIGAVVVAPRASNHVDVLQATGGLPPDVVGQFRQPAAFQQAPDGRYFVFDRRGHRVHRVDSGAGETTTLVDIGPESGRILGGSSFDLGPGPSPHFVVADAPEGRERVQIFDTDGMRVGGFALPGRASPRVILNNTVLSGVGTLHFTGREIIMNQPELGGLMTRFSLRGQPFHTFGIFRRTGHEVDRDVHLALNSGIPLAVPDGGFYFVFQTGAPVIRKYDARGELVFERHIEGPELDATINGLPTTWPSRAVGDGQTLPFIPPNVTTAALDRRGNLWVALAVPFVYVYDASGEKIRTVRLRGAGPLQASSLSFPDATRLLVTPGCYEFTVW